MTVLSKEYKRKGYRNTQGEGGHVKKEAETRVMVP